MIMAQLENHYLVKLWKAAALGLLDRYESVCNNIINNVKTVEDANDYVCEIYASLRVMQEKFRHNPKELEILASIEKRCDEKAAEIEETYITPIQ